jgi:glycosyltransferase involved in cell wall biosynthesis
MLIYENDPQQKFNQVELQSRLKCNVIYLKKGFDIFHRAIRFDVVKHLKKIRPDVVFVNEYGATTIVIVLLKLLYKYSIISTTSDNEIIFLKTGWIRNIIRSYVIGSSHGLIVYSDRVKQLYESKYEKIKVLVCPNIQNPNTLLSLSSELDDISKKYLNKYNDTNIKILYVGRLSMEKNLFSLIESLYRIQLPLGITLYIVGDGELRSSLIEYNNKLTLLKTSNRKVQFVGRFDGADLYAWYRYCDFLVLPSTHEPYGAVVNEALIFGIPVLCSSNAGAIHLVSNGVNGLVYNPKNDNLSEKIEQMINLLSKFKVAKPVEEFYGYVKNYSEIVK